MTCVIREIPELCWNFSKRIPLCADSTQRFKYESPTLLELSKGGKISEGIFIFFQPSRNFWYILTYCADQNPPNNPLYPQIFIT